MFGKKPKKEAEEASQVTGEKEGPLPPQVADLTVGYFAMKHAKAECELKILQALIEFSQATRLNVIGLDLYRDRVMSVGRSDQTQSDATVYSVAVVACLP